MKGVQYEFSTLTHLNLSFPFVFLSSRFFGLSFKVIFLCVKSASNSERLVYNKGIQLPNVLWASLKKLEVPYNLNFIRLLRVVITPSVVERRKRLEAFGWISG